VETWLRELKRRDGEDLANSQRSRYISLGDLVDHYKQTELCDRSEWYSEATKVIYTTFLKTWIRPHWAMIDIRDVRTIAVENWLRQLRRKDGKPACEGKFQVNEHQSPNYWWQIISNSAVDSSDLCKRSLARLLAIGGGGKLLAQGHSRRLAKVAWVSSIVHTTPDLGATLRSKF
jgi:hypothetical protein